MMNLRHLPSLPHWLVPSARLRIYIIYLWRHRRWPDLRAPRRFTELVQWRKLYDHDPRMTVMADKIAAKKHVEQKLGGKWIIPTYWSGRVLPEHPSWPYPFILKASHGCNQNFICRNPADWKKARRASAKWLRAPYGLWLDEWAYRAIPRSYIVEPYLGTGHAVPVDYKIYVFGGKAAFVQVHMNRYSDHRWILFDRQWKQLSRLGDDALPLAPASLARILDGAEKIAADFDFARIDFYEIAGEPKFGEVTFYPGSGLDPFDPPELDDKIGALWLGGLSNQADRPYSAGQWKPKTA
ncbi:ATP-grasp fold amidoligase family protein [Parasphingorhabdus sp.]|uniref:ATP-grasp fold amidoligase family protein n=1 Tax=Parasphingorhabdus sp. TaxID=2709688 RepID=UPI003A8EC07A